MTSSRARTLAIALALVFVTADGATRLAGQAPRDSAPTAPLPTGEAAIVGTVVSDDADSRPVRRAVVSVAGAGLGGDRKTVTDDQGHFAMTKLPDGRYTVSASKAGWVTIYYGSTHPGRPAYGGSPIVVKAGPQPTTLTLRLLHGSALAGVVTDAFGRPTPEVDIELVHVRVRNGQRSFDMSAFNSGSYTTTDDRGAFRLYGIAPGDYLLLAQVFFFAFGQQGVTQLRPDDLASARRAIGSTALAASGPTNSSGSNGTRAPTVRYAPVYYPGTVDIANATIITVGRAEERSGLDVALQLVRTTRVQGQVLKPDGQPAAGAIVQLQSTSSEQGVIGMFMGQSQARATPDGRFEFSSVMPGAYDVIARGADEEAAAEQAAGARAGAAGANLVIGMPARFMNLWASSPLTVAGEDVSGVTLNLQRGATISGHLVFVGTSLKPPADVTRLRLTLTSPGPEAQLGPLVAAQVDASGTFHFANVAPGHYRAQVQNFNRFGMGSDNTPVGWLPLSAMVGAVDVFDQPFDVTLSNPIPDMVVTFTDQMGEITGKVQDAAGRPVTDYRIVVFTADRALWGLTGRRMKEPVSTDADGTFRVEGLVGGNYYLAAVTDMEPDDLTDAAFLGQLAASAIPLTLANGEKKIQNLRVSGR